MSSLTEILELLKINPVTDGALTFNIDTMLNDNWDKIEAAIIEKAAKNGLSTEKFSAADGEEGKEVLNISQFASGTNLITSIINFGMPDYSKVAWTTNNAWNQAPKDGYVKFHQGGDRYTTHFYVNSIASTSGAIDFTVALDTNCSMDVMIPIPKGYYYYPVLARGTLAYFPAKGAN